MAKQIVSNVQVYGLEESIRRAKYPLSVDTSKENANLTRGIRSLAQCQKGEGHDQWLTGVIVQFDLTFSNKAWVELERYHFIDFVSSQSTVHRITKFDLDTAYNEYVDPRVVNVMREKVAAYNAICEMIRQTSGKWDAETSAKVGVQKKEAYLAVLYNNPAGFMLTAGMTTNYRQLKTIYAQRKSHILPEWRLFCEWIETLPHSELIVGEKNSGSKKGTEATKSEEAEK